MEHDYFATHTVMQERVHIDQTYDASVKRVHYHLPDEAERLLKGRVRIINVWRPIQNPVAHKPLAVADWRTVDQQDLVPVEPGRGLAVAADVVEELGADAYVYGHLATDANPHVSPLLRDAVGEAVPEAGDTGGAPENPLVIRVDGRQPPRAGATLWVAPAPDRVHLFDAGSGERLAA